MKILSKKKWEKMNQLVVNLQLDLNDTREQLKISEEQVEYLQKELKKEKKKNGRK